MHINLFRCLETLADLAPNLLAEGKSKKRKRNDTNFERIVVDSDEDFLQGDDDVAEFEREEVVSLNEYQLLFFFEFLLTTQDVI